MDILNGTNSSINATNVNVDKEIRFQLDIAGAERQFKPKLKTKLEEQFSKIFGSEKWFEGTRTMANGLSFLSRNPV